tara:strand:- start:1036 stop:2466 length:1431 start_codon:yes stop_codon:yes gene_type:complete
VHITHPVAQALLSKELADNWKKVAGWLAQAKYSVDDLRLSQANERAVSDINFKVHTAKKQFIQATADWIVQTDITRFYPSIYTHSIPWAAYGKAKVKEDIKLFSGSLADRLDILVRATNRNQTIGIPIGPETSRIIAEIVSSRVDREFAERLKTLKSNQVDRLQDDWFIGVSSLSEAEKVLSDVSHVYREFGLEINGSKTSIERVVKTTPLEWKSELSAFLSHRSGRLTGTRLREFLELSARIQAKFPMDPVVNYALSVVETKTYVTDDAEILESFLLKAASLSPGSLDKICRVLINVDRETGGISKKRVTERFTRLMERNFENGNLYEVIWLAYAIRGLKQRLQSKLVSELCEFQNGSALPLILLDMHSKGLVARKLPVATWEASISPDRVEKDWIWLLAYEGIRRGWLTDHRGVMSKRLFKPLNDHSISFYDTTKNVVRSRKAVTLRYTKAKSQGLAAATLMRYLRGFEDWWDY